MWEQEEGGRISDMKVGGDGRDARASITHAPPHAPNADNRNLFGQASFPPLLLNRDIEGLSSRH